MAINILNYIFPSYINSTTTIGFIIFTLIIAVLVYLFIKVQQMSLLQNNITYLKKTLDDLDGQAKLIIKSDIELKLYQEEVDDKLNKLNLLRNLILSSIHILDKEDLFSQITEKTINDLGFKKGLILNYDSLEVKTNIAFKEKEISAIKTFLDHKKNLFLTQPMITGDSSTCKDISTTLQTKDIILASLRAREKIHSIFIVSNLIVPTQIKNADKAIYSIISMYLGQCLDNIKLFEDLYLAKDALESKIKERTNELVKSLREIEIISKTKSDFISSVSHELRTPLTSVKGFSSLLVSGKFGELPDEARKRLEKIDENVNKLVDMVNALLDISRIESGKTEVKIAPCDIVKLIKDTVEFLMPQMQQKQITLSIDLPKEKFILADKNLIERVLINLINNALKFTNVNGKITLKCAEKEKQIIVSVSDTGCGIPKDDIEKIFSEFYRVNNSTTKAAQGSGLGLSLVKQIIGTHKEKIWIESEVDAGTTFYFTLKSA